MVFESSSAEMLKHSSGKEHSSDKNSDMVKYCPKHKYGKPVGRREIVEKYAALGLLALERDFNGGRDFTEQTLQFWSPMELIVNRKHFAISVRAHYYACHQDQHSHEPPGKKLLRRAAKEAVRDELLDFEDCE